LGIYFDNEENFEKVQHLWDLKCKECGDISKTVTQLQRHLKSQHNLQFCDVCLDDKKNFCTRTAPLHT